MPKERVQSFRQMHTIDKVAGGLLIWQAVGPAKRIASSEKKLSPLRLLDWGRLAVGGMVAYHMATDFLADFGGVEGIASNTRDALSKGKELGVGEKKVKVPGWAVALVASAGIATLVGTLNYLEEHRNEVALKEAPEEVAAVRAAFDKHSQAKKEVKVDGKKVEVTGTQAFAQEYADKFLEETENEKGGNKRETRKAVEDARKLVRAAYDPANPNPELQEALQLVAGDAFEAILLEKEMPETAGVITSRPRDKALKFLRDLPAAVDSLPIISFLTPSVVKKSLKALAGEQAFSAGNLNLDPRSFIGAGSEKTLAEVKTKLRGGFEEWISAEEANDATGAQISLINSLLPTGLKVSDRAKDGKMNTIVAAIMVQEHPELTPKVAEIVGILDVFQNRPQVLGKEIASMSPSYRRRTKAK